MLSSEKLDRRLTFVEWMGWFIHLMVCPPCKFFRRQIMLLHMVTVNFGSSLEEEDSEVPLDLQQSTDERGPHRDGALSEDVKRKIRAIISTE